MNNSRPKERIFKLYKYLVSLKEISTLAKINFFQLFEVYSNFKKQDKIENIAERKFNLIKTKRDLINFKYNQRTCH